MKKLTSIIILFFAVFSIAIAEKPKSKQFGEAFNLDSAVERYAE